MQTAQSQTQTKACNRDAREIVFLKLSQAEILTQDKPSLDITWLKDKSLADLDNLPDPDIIAAEIIENLEAGLESFREIIAELKKKIKYFVRFKALPKWNTLIQYFLKGTI